MPGRASSPQFPATWFLPAPLAARRIDRALASLRESAGTGLHLGCGQRRIEGLINCDKFNPSADRALDALDLSELESGSVPLIETHHMIEHLSFDDTQRALVEWHRVLAPNGWLVLTCPDLGRVCLEWIKRSVFYNPKKLDYIVQMLVGSQEHEGMFHRNAFDRRRLSRLLGPLGFQVVYAHAPYPIRPTPSLLLVAQKCRA